MRSISTKLILAFLSIGIISVAIIVLTARWNTRAEFIRFLSDQDQSDIVTKLSEHYRETGSWVGAQIIFFRREAGPNRRPPPFLLTDEKGIAILPNGRYNVGDQVPRSELAAGVPIMQDGQVIGILVPIRAPFEGNP